MVRLVLTDRLVTTLEELGDVKRDGALLPLDLLEALQTHLEAKQAWVEHRLLARISRWNKSTATTRSEYTLHELIRGSEVYIDPPILGERSPELEAILAPIRLAQEQATYASYLSGTTQTAYKDPFDLRTTENWDFRTASHPRTTVKQEWEAVRRELSAIANVLASMAAIATAVWWAAGTTPVTQKTLMSLFGAIAIAAIEGFLYFRFFQRSRTLPAGKTASSTSSTSNGSRKGKPEPKQAIKARS